MKFQIPNSKFQITSRGLTLVELMVAVAIFFIVMAGASITFSSFLTRNQLDSHTHQLIQTLRRAEANALAHFQNSSWGVHLDAAENKYIFFKGADYASHDTSSDEKTALPSSLAFADIVLAGGGTDLIFHKGDGAVAGAGSFRIKEGPNHSFTLYVNAYGRVDADPLLLTP